MAGPKGPSTVGFHYIRYAGFFLSFSNSLHPVGKNPSILANMRSSLAIAVSRQPRSSLNLESIISDPVCAGLEGPVLSRVRT
jgi:hypothetical protein